MDTKRAWVPALFAVAAAAFYLLSLNSKENALTGRYQTAKVLVARVDIPERTLLREDLVELEQIPRRWVAQDAVEVRVPTDVRMIANAVSRVRIPKGNQISQSALMPLNSESGLALRVPPGYRATMVPVDGELRVMVKPGDRVDVLVTFDAVLADGRREKATATILQNVLVLAVGRDLGQGMTADRHKLATEAETRATTFSEKSTISVAVNPRELQFLALALQQGSTSIGVRSPGDTAMHPIDISVMRQLFGG